MFNSGFAMPHQFASDDEVMRYALVLAQRGLGAVEPNPPVGAVVVNSERRLLGEGWHQKFGGPHAEVFALQQAGPAARGATLFVTLEPCCHFGKTPPCTQAIREAGIARVVAAIGDPAQHASGGGFRELEASGITVELGQSEAEARRLLAPYVKLTTTGRPWVHAKWAMTCDGKLASWTRHSRWISSEASRRIVHQLRGRMDAIIVGIGTVLADDPLLLARPPGPRTATRIVLDREARLPPDSLLVKSVTAAPVYCAAGRHAPEKRIRALQASGVEIMGIAVDGDSVWDGLLARLGECPMTHVLIEGGSRVLGTAFDAGIIDEYHVFIAPKLLGGEMAPSPISGLGLEEISPRPDFSDFTWQVVGEDVYLHGYARPKIV